MSQIALANGTLPKPVLEDLTTRFPPIRNEFPDTPSKKKTMKT
jgi:hypothetical protein